MEITTARDRMMPVQPELCNYYEGNGLDYISSIYESVYKYADLKCPQEEFTLEFSTVHTIDEMASSPMYLRFLQMLVWMKRPMKILEIGTFIGVSTLYLAQALPEGAEMIAIEKFDEFANVAQKNITANGFSNKITLINGDALVELEKMQMHKFDMVFLDGDKGRYDEYFLSLDRLILPGGLLVVDDVFFNGDALNVNPKTEKGSGVKRFLELVNTRKDYTKLLLPVANGVMFLIKQ
jgi:predicted O-methyltransferase YrrM